MVADFFCPAVLWSFIVAIDLIVCLIYTLFLRMAASTFVLYINTFNMSRRTEIKLKQLSAIILAWLVIGCLMSVYDHLVLLTHNSIGPSEQYSFQLALTFNLTSALIGGILGGSILVFYVNVKYQDKPYLYTITAVTISFLLIIALIIIVIGAIAVPLKTGKPFTDPRSYNAFQEFLMDSSRAKNIMFWFVVVSLTQFLLQINSKFGFGLLGNVIRGKYNTPKSENRIFMFLDLNSSTAIAEQLGDEKYHALLKDFFADITNPVLENKGEIYQYVGDEVVIAWDYEVGIENNNCVRCFFDIKQLIEKNQNRYTDRYGFVPSFKGGIHSGQVVAGEVGIIKREITYSGDVLNTTSRMLNLCRKFNAEVISSGNLISKLQLDNGYVTEQLGSIKLRGKDKEVTLSAIRPLAA
jgi:adenylate cyclase